jgi:hypothetical protein
MATVVARIAPPIDAAWRRLGWRGRTARWLSGQLVVRAALLAVVIAAASIAQPSPRTDKAAGLGATTRQVAFSVVGWEARALAAAAAAPLARQVAPTPTHEAERVALVRAHFANTDAIQKLRDRRDSLFQLPSAERDGLADVERQIQERETVFDKDRATTEAIVGDQVDAEMRALGLRGEIVERASGDGWPLPFVRITPPVFFTFQRLPFNLLIAPRDQIAITGSVLISPDLSTGEIEQLESRVDTIGVSSLVSGIGGLGSYPSMIPDSAPLRRSLEVVSHEWTHHYLALHPLGRAFFTSYEMRTINETVADMVGEEVAAAVWQRHYAPTESPPPPAPPASRSAPRAAAPQRDFGTEMRRIRREVEMRLALRDVDGAERYMEEQRHALADMGWHVRKLNTAYLSFFGAYGGGGNRFEAPLRALRASSGSLAAFLQRVQSFETPAEVLAAR